MSDLQKAVIDQNSRSLSSREKGKIRCGMTETTFGTNEYGLLSANFGYGSSHDGERYQVHLCDMCFFGILATVREMHRGHHMFDDDYEAANPDKFGRI